MTEETGSGSAPELATFDRYRRDVPTSADATGDDGSGPLVDALGRAIAGRTTRVAIRGTSGTGRTRLIERARTRGGPAVDRACWRRTDGRSTPTCRTPRC